MMDSRKTSLVMSAVEEVMDRLEAEGYDNHVLMAGLIRYTAGRMAFSTRRELSDADGALSASKAFADQYLQARRLMDLMTGMRPKGGGPQP